VEVLRHDYTCFDATHYGALMIVDPEEEFFKEEVHKLAEDIGRHGLSLIIMGEWYNVATFPELKFHDQNTKRYCWISMPRRALPRSTLLTIVCFFTDGGYP
jgi:membrane-bound transcription factor site-1 protease